MRTINIFWLQSYNVRRIDVDLVGCENWIQSLLFVNVRVLYVCVSGPVFRKRLAKLVQVLVNCVV